MAAMMSWTRLWVAVAVGSLASPLPAVAVEYRLKVASLHEEAFYALLGSAGTRREGPVEGPSRLIEVFDMGEVPAGVLLYDRTPEPARAPVVKAFGGVRVRLEVGEGEAETERWSEMRWEGKPGERSVWVIPPLRTWYGELRDVALRGTGELVRAIPHLIARSQPPAKALGIPLEFIQAYEGIPALWNRYLSTVVDLSDGIAVIVGVNSDSPFADQVVIVAKHAPSPTTYHVVLAWRSRPSEVEAPDGERNRLR